MPKLVHGGRYLDRKGRPMWVRLNTEGWLDGLPFIVSDEPMGHPHYTVNEEGLVYPDDHKIFRDDQGYYPLDLFREGPRYPQSFDLVARA